MPIAKDLIAFREFGRETIQLPLQDSAVETPVYVNEFWTARQRAAHSLHEISYRACFKPQLPRFFIDRLTNPGDFVFDPFMGRGTTVLEAALLNRRCGGADINPLSSIMLRPRLRPPSLAELDKAIDSLPLDADPREYPEDLLVFYHPKTLRQLCALREFFIEAESSGQMTDALHWVRMVSLNRLTGHSPGFFSVYTLPPNQATSVKAQIRINQRRKQTPPERDIRGIIRKKSLSLLTDLLPEERSTLHSIDPLLITGSAEQLDGLPDESVSLVVTSPPFLDVVDYTGDNWLRGWFCGIDTRKIQIAQYRKLEDWQGFMTGVFRRLRKALISGGHIAFEVGEVRGGKIKLENAVVDAASDAGLEPRLVLINDQKFTKTANCWGVDNNGKGTNTNRIVLLRKS